MNTLNTTYKKNDGDILSATTWNGVVDKINETVEAINAGGGEGGGLPNIYINEKGNLNIETSAELGNTKKGKINIESMDDIQIKPGDDITFYSHHREGNEDEVAIKVMNGAELIPEASDYPVKLQINCSEINLTTKDKNLHPKNKDKANVMDVVVNQSKNKKGYLKVRAQAIDLRCEEHGGIALQPKGKDGQGNMNKIKFEHGGGDGLEFGTFNTEKSSLFTDEYRFNKNGIIKIATRQTVTSDKMDASDDTTYNKYVKQSDDFYDIISSSDPTCTWEDIVKYIHWAKTNNQGPWAA